MRRNPVLLNNKVRWLLGASLLLIAGCSPDSPTDLVNDVASLAEATAGQVAFQAKKIESHDRLLARIAREEIPGFAGFVYEAGEPLLLTTRPSEHASAVEKLRGLFPNDRGLKKGFRVKQAKYDFDQLRNWADLSAELSGESLMFLDVDERNNRVLIGVDEASKIGTLRSELIVRGIPGDAVFLEVRGPIRYQGDLNEVLFSIPGGAQIQREDGGFSSLGPHVTVNGQSGYALAAAHSTGTIGVVHGKRFAQPSYSADFLHKLVEVADPPKFTGGDCPFNRECRWADVAILEFVLPWYQDNFQIAYPGIGDTYFFETMVQKYAWGEVWVLAPPTAGFDVEMVGSTSGRQRGDITHSCAHGTGEDGTYFPCVHFADFSGTDGDSGAPVYSNWGTHAGERWAVPYGVFLGRTETNLSVFSDLSLANEELAENGWYISAMTY